jgi:hypothetical protein
LNHEDVTPGTFYDAQTLEEFNTVEVVPLATRNSRLKTEDGIDVCASTNGSYAVDTLPGGKAIPLFPGAKCQECEFFAEMPWPEGRLNYCEPQVDILAFHLETREFISIRMMRSNFWTGKKLEQLADRVQKAGRYQKVRLFSHLATSKQGFKYFRISLKVLGLLTEEEYQVVGTALHELNIVTA